MDSRILYRCLLGHVKLEIGFKELGTGVNAANDKIGKLENMVQDLTSLIKNQQEKITKKEKEEGEALIHEVSGQILDQENSVQDEIFSPRKTKS